MKPKVLPLVLCMSAIIILGSHASFVKAGPPAPQPSASYIVVEKTAKNGNDSFFYTVYGQNLLGVYGKLAEAGTTTTNGSGNVYFDVTKYAGDFKIEETLPSSTNGTWAVTSISCTQENGTQTGTVSLSSNSVKSIHVVPGTTVTCKWENTFTENSPPPSSTPPPPPPPPGTSALYHLELGETNDLVQKLQRFLNQNGFLVSQTGPGSLGRETSYFGKLTKEAVSKLQIQYGLNQGSQYLGVVGPWTQDILRKLGFDLDKK